MSSLPLRIMIGYDSKEPAAYHVLAHSIIRRASHPVSITPLHLPSLRHIYTRERGPTESTEFSITRFLVPHLSGFGGGYSIFMDCDMLCRVDIGDIMLYVMADPGKAVYVCQHDYTPKNTFKFQGKLQMGYPRKNWSSLMVFDNARCAHLTTEYVNQASGLDLHQFNWLKDDQIGSLPLEWNWLVGEYPANLYARILHYTIGGPWWPDCAHCDHADLWLNEREELSIVPAGVR